MEKKKFEIEIELFVPENAENAIEDESYCNGVLCSSINCYECIFQNNRLLEFMKQIKKQLKK